MSSCNGIKCSISEALVRALSPSPIADFLFCQDIDGACQELIQGRQRCAACISVPSLNKFMHSTLCTTLYARRLSVPYGSPRHDDLWTNEAGFAGYKKFSHGLGQSSRGN